MEQDRTKKGIYLADVISFRRKGRQYVGTYTGLLNSLCGLLLRPDNSDVELEVSRGIGSINMCVHLDSLPFAGILAENECLVAPIIEVNAHPILPFKCRIKIPHCLRKSELHSVIVRHGDIYNKKPFSPVPHIDELNSNEKPLYEEHYEIDESFVYIYASSFSQFTCTTCKRKCVDDQVMFLSAGWKGKNLEIRPFICNPLFNIPEYKHVCK